MEELHPQHINSLLNQVTGAQCLIKHSLGVIAECNFSADPPTPSPLLVHIICGL